MRHQAAGGSSVVENSSSMPASVAGVSRQRAHGLWSGEMLLHTALMGFDAVQLVLK
jgi:hypothetical protein